MGNSLPGVGKYGVGMMITDMIDTTTWFTIGFDNKAYQYIKDNGYIILVTRDEVTEFQDKLSEFLTYDTKTSTYSLEFSQGIIRSSYGNNFKIEDKNSKYFYISRKNVQLLIDKMTEAKKLMLK